MNLKIALLQTDPVWENVDCNLQNAAEMITTAEADLVILPEMFATGFSMNPAAVADRMDGTVPQWMRETARRTGAALMGSVAIRERDNAGTEVYYNRLLFVSPQGDMQWYDKRHLFRMGEEPEVYRGGMEQLTVQYNGFRIRPVICYDLRFPVWCRNRRDYDLLVDVACWPASRREVWRALLQARAIENVCYVAGVNRVGHDPLTNYTGDSLVCDFRGRMMAKAEGETSQIVSTVLNREALEEFRENFPVHLDADAFEIVG